MKQQTHIIKHMTYLLKLAWKEERISFLAMWGHIITGFLTPWVGVWIPSIIIAQLLQGESITEFMSAIGLVLVFYGILQGLLGFFQEYTMFAFVRFRVLNFVKRYYQLRSVIPYAYLEDEQIRTQLEDAKLSIRNNADGLEGMFHCFIQLMIAILGLLLYAISSSGLSVTLTLCLFVLVIIQYGCFSFARNYEFSHRTELSEYLVKANYLNQLAYDTSAGKDIRLYQLQDWINEKFTSVNRLIHHIKRKDFGAYMIVDSIAILLDVGRDIVCYLFLINQLRNGLPIDQFVFYLGIISGFSIWFKRIGESYARMSKNDIEVTHLFDAFDLEQELQRESKTALAARNITICFDHVSFHYPNSDREILDDVSFTLHEGERLALVGVNGAGKTTIVKLILGFYHPTSGSILINGIPTTQLDQTELLQHMTGVFQDSEVMSYTIAENISMQDLQDTDLKRVKKCLNLSGFDEVVRELPNQELTYLHKDIDDTGISLSGGQIQRLFMARALYYDRACLLLDEPTAALDAIAEQELYEQYKELTTGKSSLFISHRLSSTRFCDHIIVLDQGKLVEQGTHAQLMDAHGIYANMFEVQAKYYQEVQS